MTKKTLEALADALYREKPRTKDIDCPIYYGWTKALIAVADVAGELNPRFDRPYFMTRCVQGPKIKRMRGEL